MSDQYQTQSVKVRAVQLTHQMAWYFTHTDVKVYEPGDWIVIFDDMTQMPFSRELFEKLFKAQ